MTTFLRLLAEPDKAAALLEVCSRQRAEGSGQWVKGRDPRVFEVAPEAFDAVPGKPFAYWVSEAVRETFRRLPGFEGGGTAMPPELQIQTMVMGIAKPEVMADLGHGVMDDAMVEAAAYCLIKS